jgi:hypothetical protein
MLLAFGRALADAMHAADVSPREVAEAVGWTADYVLKLQRGTRAPNPWGLFAVEDFLGLQPGELSRHLGYVPEGAVGTVAAALDADTALTSATRRMLLAAYRAGRRG